MKTKTATKPLLKQYGKLLAAREAAFQAVFDAVAPRRDVPWQTCFKEHADEATRERYREAHDCLFRFELRMAHDEGRGWFDNGCFRWY